MLLTSGGLLLQTFQHLRQLDLGIRSEKLLTFVTPLFRYRDFDQRVAFVNAELETDSRDSRRRQRRRDFANSADGQRPVDVLSARGPVQRRSARTGRALARRDPRLLLHGRRAPARRPILRHLRPAVGHRRWRSSTNPLPIATFPDVRRSARDSSSDSSGEQGLLVHDRRRREGDSRSRRGGGIEARGLSRARTGGPDRGPAERHRGSHGGRAGVDCSGGSAGDLVRRQEPADRARSNHRRHRGSPVVRAVAEHGAA